MQKDQMKKKLSAELDDCNIQEGRMTEANDTHWKVHVDYSAVDESTITDDGSCHNHGNEVHEKEYVQQNKSLHIC